jgi:hypothetical protein
MRNTKPRGVGSASGSQSFLLFVRLHKLSTGQHCGQTARLSPLEISEDWGWMGPCSQRALSAMDQLR